MFSKYTALIFCLLAFFTTKGQVNYTANDQVAPYLEPFRPGINFGSYPTYTDEELAELAAGNPSLGINGVGVKAARPGLFDAFTSIYGVDSRVSTYQYYEQLGLKENTVIVGFPSPEHQDETFYCSNIQSTLFKNMYLDIWDNSDGTPINEENYYAKYLYDVVSTYKDYVKFWEIWNEPGFDYTGALGSLPPGTPNNWWDNNPDPCDYKLHAPIFHYVRLLRISYEVIKTLDPDAYVTVSGTGFPSFLDAILRNTDNPVDGSVTADYPLGGGAYFDVMGYHAYPHFDGSLRNWNDNIQDWEYHRHSDAAAQGLKASKDSIQVVLASHGYDGLTFPKKNWIITESNLPRKAFGEFIGSDAAQTNFIIKSYVQCVRDSIAQMHYYKISEDTDYEGAYNEFHLMGLYQKLNNQAPIYQLPTDEGIALATSTELLFGKTLDEAKLAELNLPETIRGAAFLDENGQYTYVLWAKTTTDQSEVASANFSFPAILDVNQVFRYHWDYSQSKNFSIINSNNITLTGRPIFLVPSNFTFSDQNFCLNSPTTFYANNIPEATSYAWTFEGGNPTASTLNEASVTFQESGNHLITCTIFDINGNVLSQQSSTIFVAEMPTPDFYPAIYGPLLRIDSLVGYTNNQAITWDFGDGTSSSLANPEHLYFASGSYDITLTLSSNCGPQSITKTVQIIVPTTSNITYTSNDSVVHLHNQFRPGANLKTFPNWSDTQLADIAAGNNDLGIKGAGVKSFRTILGENFLDYWGYDIRLNEFQHYQNLGISNNTITLGTPTFQSVDSFSYCPNKQTAVFANMYLDIWDDGSDGTLINEENYFANYVYKTVITYRDYVRYWEIFNSPDYDIAGNTGWLPSGQLGNWWDNNPDPCDIALGAPIFYYNRMLRIAYEVIKTYDDDAFVTIPGLGYPSFLDAVLRNTDNPEDGSIATGYPLKGGAYFDAIGIKSFPHFDGSTSHYDPNVGGLAYDRHSDAAVQGIITNKEKFEQVLANYGYGSTYPSKEWILSEANLPRLPFDEFIGSEIAQVDWIIKAYVISIKHEIRQLDIFSIAEKSASPANSIEAMGLYKNLDAVTPYNQMINNEGMAYKTVSDLLFSTQYSQDLTDDLNLSENVDGAAFVNGAGEKIFVLWSKTTEDQQEYSESTYTFPATLFPGTFYVLPWDYSYSANLDTITNPSVQLLGTPKFFVESVPVLMPPLASFTVDQQEACPNVPIHFTNQSTTNSTSFHWTFPQGNPATSDDENPTVSFAEAGTYAISLEVSNAAGSHQATYLDYVTVLPKPSANFSFYTDGSVAHFTNLSNDATSYDWTFGDNSGTYHPVNPEYYYNQNGTYPVMLIAINNCSSDTMIQDVVISSTPDAQFFSIIESCDSPYVYHYINSSFNNPTSWLWSFEGGEPATSSEANPYITYSETGIYSTTLIATNENGSDTISQSVTINGLQNEFIIQDLCAGDSLVLGDSIFNESHPSGEFWLWNSNGCDTLVHVNLTFSPIEEIYLVDSIESGSSYQVGTSVYTEAGSYTDSLTSFAGCDSIVHLDLSIYIIEGIKNLSGIHNISSFPNPTKDWLTIQFLLAQKTSFNMEVMDIRGHQVLPTIQKVFLEGKQSLLIYTEELPSGIYFVKLINKEQVYVLRFVKSK